MHLVQDINQRDDSGMNALHYCALTGAADMAKVLFETKKVDVEARTSDGLDRTALIVAAILGSGDVIDLLIDQGAKIEAADKKAISPLEWAVHFRRLEVAVRLIEAGAKTSFRPTEVELMERVNGTVQPARKLRPRSTILHTATAGNSSVIRPASILKQLLEDDAIGPKMKEEARLNVVDVFHHTPLQLAARRGDLDGLKALLRAGADPTITNDIWGRSKDVFMGTALEIAQKSLSAFDRRNPHRTDVYWLKDATEEQKIDYQRSLQEIILELSRIPTGR